MEELPDLRVSDSEREAAAAALSVHYAQGRIDDAELDERLNAAYGARTRSELEAVTADLPALPPGELQARAELSLRRRHLRRRTVQEAGGGLVPFGVCTVIWAATGAGTFWPVWILIAVLIPLLRNGWALYGPAPDLDQVEANLDRRQDHRARHADRQARHADRHARHAERRSGRRGNRRRQR